MPNWTARRASLAERVSRRSPKPRKTAWRATRAGVWRPDSVCNAGPAELTRVIDRFRTPGGPSCSACCVPLRRHDRRHPHESLMRVWTKLVRWVRRRRSTEIYRRSYGAPRSTRPATPACGAAGTGLGVRWLRDNQPSAAWRRRRRVRTAIGFLQRSRRAHRLRSGCAARRAARRARHRCSRSTRGVSGTSRGATVGERRLQAEYALTEAKAAATRVRDAQSQEVQELRTRNAAMKASGTANRPATRSSALATLREATVTSRTGSSAERENALLEERSAFRPVFSQLDSERETHLRVSGWSRCRRSTGAGACWRRVDVQQKRTASCVRRSRTSHAHASMRRPAAPRPGFQGAVEHRLCRAPCVGSAPPPRPPPCRT